MGAGAEDVIDLAEFIEALGRLRADAGNPAFRTLAGRVGPLLKPPRDVAFRTIADLFQPGRRRLDLDLVVAVVRALGADEMQTQAWREAYLRVHFEAQTGGPIGVRRQLPGDLATFTGREDHLRRLIDQVGEAGERVPATVVISAIEGMGGVGKTTLAVHAAHELVSSGKFADVQLFANLRGFDPERPPAEPAAVLGAFLRALDVPARNIPQGLDARAAMFRDQMRGRSGIVLLDNAESEAQVRDLNPGQPGCLVLITSRRALAGLDGAVAHRLDVFTPDEARMLYGRIVGDGRVMAEPEARDELVGLCDGLPLAVALAAAYTRGRPDWKLADVASRLTDGALSGLRVGDRRLAAVFELSYKSLTHELRRAFRLLSLHPGEDFTADLAAALIGADPGETYSLLDTLIDEHLLLATPGRRYEFHDLLRTFASERSKTEDDPAVRREAMVRALSWLAHASAKAALALAPTRMTPLRGESDSKWRDPRFDGYEDAYAWFAAGQANLTAAVHLAAEIGADSECWKIAYKMSDFQMLAAQPGNLLDTLHVALDCANRSNDEEGQSAITNVLAIAEAEHGSRERAVELFTQATVIRSRLGRPDSAAVALGNLGVLYHEMGRLDEAADVLTRALSTLRSIESYEGSGVAVILTGLGQVYLDQGRQEDAEKILTQAIAVHTELGDERGIAYATNELGTCAARRGDIQSAIRLREEALTRVERLGFCLRVAKILDDLAADCEALGSTERAEGHRRQALEIRGA